MAYQYGLPFDVSGLSLNDKLLQIQQYIDGLAKAAISVKAAGNDPGEVARLTARLRIATNAVAGLRAELNGSDAPAAIMVQLDSFSDSAIAAGKTIGSDVQTAVTTTISILPILAVALVVFGIIYLNKKGVL